MKKGVVILASYYEAIRDLADDDRLLMYDSLIRYGLLGEEPELPEHLRAYFILIRPNMDSSMNRYKTACENGKLGGRPLKNQEKEKEKKKELYSERKDEGDARGEPHGAHLLWETL